MPGGGLGCAGWQPGVRADWDCARGGGTLEGGVGALCAYARAGAGRVRERRRLAHARGRHVQEKVAKKQCALIAIKSSRKVLHAWVEPPPLCSRSRRTRVAMRERSARALTLMSLRKTLLRQDCG